LLTPVNEGALRPLWAGSQKEVEDLIVAAFPIVDLVSQGSWFGAFAAAVDACRARTDPAGRWAIIT
jgi:hypothetical protein